MELCEESFIWNKASNEYLVRQGRQLYWPIGAGLYSFVKKILVDFKQISIKRASPMRCGCAIVPILFALATILFNECILHHLHVLIGCGWKETTGDASSLRVLMIADTHLLGKYQGHWADKLKREWQMYQSFRASLWMKPDAIFFLGDLLDEGKWTDEDLFEKYSDEFHRLFNVDGQDIQMHVLAGNHDVGFHYEMYPQRMVWFRERFNKSLVDTVRLKGHTFLLMNSMALHGDKCMLCSEARALIDRTSEDLNCLKDESKCVEYQNRTTLLEKLGQYQRPIILQHFPLYRESEDDCIHDEYFDATEPKRHEVYKNQWDCISNESTWYLIEHLQPRAVFNGHAHRGCTKRWPTANLTEYTVNSFSWRNGDRPSFLVVDVSKDKVSVSTCYLPRESTTYAIYAVNLILILLYFGYISYKTFYAPKSVPDSRMYIPVHRNKTE